MNVTIKLNFYTIYLISYNNTEQLQKPDSFAQPDHETLIQTDFALTFCFMYYLFMLEFLFFKYLVKFVEKVTKLTEKICYFFYLKYLQQHNMFNDMFYPYL